MSRNLWDFHRFHHALVGVQDLQVNRMLLVGVQLLGPLQQRYNISHNRRVLGGQSLLLR